MARNKDLNQRNDGSWLEGKVKDMLDTLHRKTPSFYLRLRDTKSASRGSTLHFQASQPGDFIHNYPGISILIEAKSSDKHESLMNCLRTVITKKNAHQPAAHRLWQRAGHPSIYLFGNTQTEQIEIWDGIHVAHAWLTREKLRPEQRLVVCTAKDMLTCYTNLIDSWRTP